MFSIKKGVEKQNRRHNPIANWIHPPKATWRGAKMKEKQCA
jgi:hypothetical protein